MRAALLACLASAALAGTAHAGCAAPARALDYRVMWGEDDIGSHRMTFRTEPNGTLVVRAETALDARILFVPVLAFRHVSEESWRDGALVSQWARTVDNGKVTELTVRREEGVFAVRKNGGEFRVDAGALPSSLWCDVTLERDGHAQYLDLVKGDIAEVNILHMGRDSVRADGAEVEARHYGLRGGVERDVWFDADGLPVHARMKPKKGSRIHFVLDRVERN